MRKAIQRAINVESILAGAYSGVSPLAHSMIHIGVLGHEPHELGLRSGAGKGAAQGGGCVRSLAGHQDPFRSGKATRLPAQIIQADLGEIGISATVSPVNSASSGTWDSNPRGSLGRRWSLDNEVTSSAPDPADAIQWFTKNQIGIWN